MLVRKRALKWFPRVPYSEYVNQFLCKGLPSARKRHYHKNNLAVMEQLFAELLVQPRGLYEIQDEQRWEIYFQASRQEHPTSLD
jgi:hypothetical protein